MNPLLQDIRHTPLLWLLVFVPVVFLAAKLKPEGQTLLFVLSVLAIVPLTVLLSHATESVAAKIGDALGGLLNATLGNLAELIIALTALRAGQYMLVKASIAGPIVTNTLFILGTSFLLGGLRHHEQEYNRVSARMQASLLFIATVALLIPSAVSQADSAAPGGVHPQAEPRAGAAAHRHLRAEHAVFPEDAPSAVCQHGAHRGRRTAVADESGPGYARRRHGVGGGGERDFRRVGAEGGRGVRHESPAFVGFIIVALVGGASAMPTAFSGARRNRLDLSVSIALGSASQIALFVAPALVFLSYFIGPTPMDLQFWPGAVVMILIATLITSLVTNTGRSAWFVGVLVLMVYLIFAMTLYLLPPRVH